MPRPGAAHGAQMEDFRARLASLRSEHDDPDSSWCAEAVLLAIAAAEEGNIGVGAVVVGDDGVLWAAGQNRLFSPSFRSDLHAEMDALDQLEAAGVQPEGAAELRIYSSLEPCPMCLTRILFSGIRVIRYAAPDAEGGMASRASQLPPTFARWAAGCDVGPAPIRSELADLAWDVHEASLQSALPKLHARWRQVRG